MQNRMINIIADFRPQAGLFYEISHYNSKSFRPLPDLMHILRHSPWAQKGALCRHYCTALPRRIVIIVIIIIIIIIIIIVVIIIIIIIICFLLDFGPLHPFLFFLS